MGHVGYGVLNTDRLTMVKLGQHGPHVDTFDRAQERAEREDHLTVVEVNAGDPAVEVEDGG